MKDVWTQKSWYQVVWVLRWRRYSTLDKQPSVLQYTAAKSLQTDKEVGYLMQLNKEVNLANLVGTVVAEE